ncbi:RNA polymerase sigma factor [Aquimarina hainanensis]|uniref:RNA polymerase sigma factor n=1 Tax=Aquimarina hainanensis TaxID=1578017 RepID=A0ABW5N8A5_9FLAO
MSTEVWQNFKSGDKNAFESIYTLYIDDMYNYGLKICSCKELVKDCIQEVFIYLYEHKNNLSEPKNLKYYILRSLKNAIYTKLSKETKINNIHKIDFSNTFSDDYLHFENKKINKEINDNKKMAVKMILKSLTPKQREILLLKFVSGHNYYEIGEITNINHNSARKQVYRVLTKIRENNDLDHLNKLCF